MNVALDILTGFVTFAKSLGEPTRIWQFEVIPFWVLVFDVLFLILLVSRLHPQTDHGIKLVVGWFSVLLAPVVVVLLIAALFFFPAFTMGTPK